MNLLVTSFNFTGISEVLFNHLYLYRCRKMEKRWKNF